MTTSAAIKHLQKEYSSSLRDPDEAPVFWLALAATGWRLGRLDEDVRQKALSIIESGQDLVRWENPGDRRKRVQVLAKLKLQLESPPLPCKPIPRTIKSATDWATGEIIGFRLLSGRWILMRVIGHHNDRGGRSAVCELLDWTGNSITDLPPVNSLSIRKEARFAASRNSSFKSRTKINTNLALCVLDFYLDQHKSAVVTRRSYGRSLIDYFERYSSSSKLVKLNQRTYVEASFEELIR
jgi:hypothetical protein